MPQTLTPGQIEPLTVYGSDLSYFTGKLEMYLRAKGIQYRFEPMHGRKIMPIVERETGTTQMPAATIADGRWITDTTPIIAWLERHYPEPPLVPTDPLQHFFSLLLEDYADEWLWRPAMHHRWYTAEGAMLQSRHLADELMHGMPLPGFVKRFMLRVRQRGYSFGDGVTEQNREQVEETYLRNLDWMQVLFSKQPFFLGNSPSLADVAFTGPFFRHFSQDPIPAEIMKQRAPAVWEWVARMWNCREHVQGDWVTGIPDEWAPWVDEIGKVYLPYLCENILAVQAQQKHFSPTVDGVTYVKAKVSPYRVWCLEQLRNAFQAMPEHAQTKAQDILERHGCWEPMWRIETLNSGVNEGVELPFACTDKMV